MDSSRQSVVRKCPVCLRIVDVTTRFWVHSDTAGNLCPMSHEPAPTRWTSDLRAAS